MHLLQRSRIYPVSFGSGSGLHNLDSHTGYSPLHGNADWIGACGRVICSSQTIPRHLPYLTPFSPMSRKALYILLSKICTLVNYSSLRTATVSMTSPTSSMKPATGACLGTLWLSTSARTKSCLLPQCDNASSYVMSTKLGGLHGNDTGQSARRRSDPFIPGFQFILKRFLTRLRACISSVTCPTSEAEPLAGSRLSQHRLAIFYPLTQNLQQSTLSCQRATHRGIAQLLSGCGLLAIWHDRSADAIPDYSKWTWRGPFLTALDRYKGQMGWKDTRKVHALNRPCTTLWQQMLNCER